MPDPPGYQTKKSVQECRIRFDYSFEEALPPNNSAAFGKYFCSLLNSKMKTLKKLFAIDKVLYLDLTSACILKSYLQLLFIIASSDKLCFVRQ